MALIDPRPLGRASIKSMLEGADPHFAVVAYAQAADLIANSRNGAKPDLVLIHAGTPGERDIALRETLRLLDRRLGAVPRVLLAEEATLQDMVMAVQLGVRGCIPNSLEPEQAVQALRLVQAGGLFLPVNAILDFFTDHPLQPAPATRSRTDIAALTRREGEVLAHISEGKPNKVIAHELKLREGTVKIYTKRLMRKLGVSNRTQAALIAQRLSGREPADDEGQPSERVS